MNRENIKHTWFHYTKWAIWKLLLAAALVFLMDGFIGNVLAHPKGHHVKPIFVALSVFFTIVFAIVSLLLIFLAIQDFSDIYEAVRDRTVVKAPSTTSVAEEDSKSEVLEQV